MSSALRTADHSTAKRLRSINHDSEFVQRLASECSLPIVANERCGLWYVPPDKLTGSAYFKSTDGHHGEWRFSARRLNLHLLEVIGRNGGYVTLFLLSSAFLCLSSYLKRVGIDAFVSRCIIADSTTRGKSMPDALSKTIPIWSCVLNNLLFPRSSTSASNSTTLPNSQGVSSEFEGQSLIYHPLETPPNIVSQTEHSQILAKVPILIRQARSLCLDFPYLRTALNNRPLRLCFTTPDRHVSPSAPTQMFQDDSWDSHIILCCSVSHHTTSPFEGYIQGAGDDSENWAHGLTPQAFWHQNSELMQAADEGEWALLEAIKKLVADEQNGIRALGQGPEREPIMPARLGKMKLFVGPAPFTGGVLHGFDVVIVCADVRPSDDAIIHTLQQQTDPWTKILRLPCGKGKTGSRALRTQLPRLIPFIDSFDLCISRILVACDTDGDLSFGVALALSCLYFDNRGFMRSRRGGEIDKDMINSRLMGVMMAIQQAPKPRPAKFSRATLQSVKAFLMPRKPGGENSREDSDED